MTPKDKLKSIIMKKTAMAERNEGFSPIYKNGVITPETRNLGPKYEKDIKLEIMKEKVAPKKPKKKEPYIPKNFNHLA